jgi:ribosomal protein S1
MTTTNSPELFRKEGKYNTSIKLTEEDKKNNVKIYCHEPYAQELYDKMVAHDRANFGKIPTKDLKVGEAYKVKATTVSYSDKMIYAEDQISRCTISIPFKEYSKSLDSLVSDSSLREFFVTVYKKSPHGEYLASERKALSITYKQELFDHLKNNTWFDVKVVKLIKGGYLAIYNKEVECFIPGSHAAANIIYNFNDLLGKTLTVMVDNYDQSNDLFILSYKKYVSKSMSTKISDLQFDKEYVGTLTTKPYDFGIFLEIDGYYTGLLHKSEFENYDEICKKLKTGDKLNVFVKDVTSKNGQYRVILTLSKDQVNSEKLQWQDLRNKTENQIFNYTLNNSNSSISIEIEGESFPVSLTKSDLSKNLTRYPKVKIFKVDPINKLLRFEFVEN